VAPRTAKILVFGAGRNIEYRAVSRSGSSLREVHQRNFEATGVSRQEGEETRARGKVISGWKANVGALGRVGNGMDRDLGLTGLVSMGSETGRGKG